jgi:hypothetical protein
MLMVAAKKEHYFREDQICIMLEEFFLAIQSRCPRQFYHQLLLSISDLFL